MMMMVKYNVLVEYRHLTKTISVDKLYLSTATIAASRVNAMRSAPTNPGVC